MTIASKRRVGRRVGDHECPICGGPGRCYRLGRNDRLLTLCFTCRAHGTLLTAMPKRPTTRPSSHAAWWAGTPSRAA